MTGNHADDELERFGALLEAFGADARRWPADRRDWALAVLARSAEAQRLQAQAARLDVLLDAAAPPAAPAALIGRVLAAAPGAAVDLRERDSWIRRFWQPVMGLAMAALFGMALGSVTSPFDNGTGAEEQIVLDSHFNADMDAEL